MYASFVGFHVQTSQPTFRKVRVLKEQTIGIDVMETGCDMGPGMRLIHWTMQRYATPGQVHCYHTVAPPSLTSSAPWTPGRPTGPSIPPLGQSAVTLDPRPRQEALLPLISSIPLDIRSWVGPSSRSTRQEALLPLISSVPLDIRSWVGPFSRSMAKAHGCLPGAVVQYDD